MHVHKHNGRRPQTTYPISCWREMLGTFCTVDSILRYLAFSHSSYFIWRCECWFLILLLDFPLLHPTDSISVSCPWLPPCPSSWSMTRKFWNAPILTAMCCLLPNLQLSQTLVPKSLLSYSHLSLFLFHLTAHLYCVSPIELPFSSLPCETCHNYLLPESVPFPCGLEMDPSFHSCLFLMKRALGAARCVNLCSGRATLVTKKLSFGSGLNCSKLTDFYLWI